MDPLAAVTHNIDQLLQQAVRDGLLDDQFLQLMQLQDESNPDFVAEVVELYFEDSASKIEKMAARLQEPMVDYNEMDQIVHQFKGSSASFGARAMAALCVQLRDACHQQNQVACQQLVAHLQESFAALHERLQAFMQLEAQRKQLSK